MEHFFFEISSETVDSVVKIAATAIMGSIVWMGKNAIKYLKDIGTNISDIKTKMEVMSNRYDAMDKRVTRLEDNVFER